MGLRVVLVSGPRRSGKSAVIRAMLDLLWHPKPHYVRLVRCQGNPRAVRETVMSPCDPTLASARRLAYDDDRVMEVIRAAYEQIHRFDRYGSMVIEADADPAVRSAYPFEHRVFVMPIPGHVHEVFRTPQDSAAAMHSVLNDTTAFATEIFGLVKSGGFLDDVETRANGRNRDGDEKADLSATQWRRFVYTPLGEELITRILLQPPYHGLAESDVIIVNQGLGSRNESTRACLLRLDKLIAKVNRICASQVRRFSCDLYAPPDETTRQLLEALAPMCRGGR